MQYMNINSNMSVNNEFFSIWFVSVANKFWKTIHEVISMVHIKKKKITEANIRQHFILKLMHQLLK